jgi:hypothetical protein
MSYKAIQADGWQGEVYELIPDDGYRDDLFPGCQYRYETHGLKIAVNVMTTGRDKMHHFSVKGTIFRCRCRIEFVGDGEPSTYANGWFYHLAV